MNTTKTNRRIDRILISFICVFFLIGLLCSPAFAKVLDVPLVTQEQDQWCWVGVSKATLDFYGLNVRQCRIAEYTRTTATWHDFGSTNCCVDASQGCNYWNYNWGYAGSVNDILQNWGVSNYGYSGVLTKAEIKEQIDGNRPFLIRWGWTAGGGHFLVGHGIDDNGMVNYMNPWPGEGLKTALYDWVVSGSNHTWTSTNILTSNPVPCIDAILPASQSFDRSLGSGIFYRKGFIKRLLLDSDKQRCLDYDYVRKQRNRNWSRGLSCGRQYDGLNPDGNNYNFGKDLHGDAICYLG